MISLVNFKGYSKNDPIDLLGGRERYVLHIFITIIITVLLVHLIDPVFEIVKFRSTGVKILEVLIFGFLFAPVILLLRKSSSLFLALLVFAPLYPFDLYLEDNVRIYGTGYALWDYYSSSFVYQINPPALRFSLTIFFDGLLIGPFCLYLTRVFAHFINKIKGRWNDGATQEQTDSLFRKIWTNDLINLGKRGFDFWVLRLLGIVYLIYFGLLLIGSLGTSPWPTELADLFKMTYENPVHGINTFGKISLMTLLAFHGAFNRNMRWFCVLGLLVGHINSTLFSVFFYFTTTIDESREFLLASAAADGLMVILFIVLIVRSKKEIGEAYKRIKGIPERFSLPLWGTTIVMYAIGVISWLYVSFMIVVKFSTAGSIFAQFKYLYETPDPMLANSLTLFVTIGLLSFLSARWLKLKDHFIGVITDPLLIMLGIGFIWYLIKNTQHSPALIDFNNYFIWFFLVTIGVVGLIFLLQRLQYNTDFLITSMHPSEAMTIKAALISFYGSKNVDPPASLKKVDLYMGNIRGRKRGLINFPFWILENLLSPLLGMRPRFSSMSEDERSHYLRKYVLRQPEEIKKAFVPSIANIAFMLGTSVKAIVTLAHLTTDKGKSQVGYIPPEMRDRLKKHMPDGFPPFQAVEPLPKNDKDPLNYKSVENDIKTAPALRTGTSLGHDLNKKEYDYVIIGSGPGGAMMAYRLAQAEGIKNENILLIERGGRPSHYNDMTDDELDMLAKLYKEGGLQQTKNFDMTVLQGECLGGTSVINNAVCFEMNKETKQIWENDYGIDLSDIDKEYSIVRKEINIHPLDDRAINQKVKNHFINGVTGYNASSSEKLSDPSPVEVNSRNEIGDGLWNLGNKRRRKLSMLDTYIQWAEGRGVEILENTNALKFVSNGKRASDVLIQDKSGEVTKIKINKSLIVAGGVIASSHFLMRSGVKGQVGHGLSCNYAVPASFIYEEEINAFDGTQITMAALDPKNRAVFETYFNPPGAYSITSPFNFNTNQEIVNNYSRSMNLGSLIGSSNTGKVHLKASPVTGRAFSWSLNEKDVEKIKYAIETLTKIGKYSGAKSTVLPTRPGLRIDLSSDNQFKDFIEVFKKYPLKMSDLIMSTAHPQGGNSMAASSKLGTSVVDEGFKLRGYSNVYLSDASIFPTSLGVNPQWTILALSSIAASQVKADNI